MKKRFINKLIMILTVSAGIILFVSIPNDLYATGSGQSDNGGTNHPAFPRWWWGPITGERNGSN